MTEELFYDLFSDGRWIGMARGVDEDDARRMAARSLPNLMGRFTLVRWHGRLHPENCKSSGGKHPDPLPEPPVVHPDAFLRHLIDVTWGIANEDESVPSTNWADRIIQQARSTYAEA